MSDGNRFHKSMTTPCEWDEAYSDVKLRGNKRPSSVISCRELQAQWEISRSFGSKGYNESLWRAFWCMTVEHSAPTASVKTCRTLSEGRFLSLSDSLKPLRRAETKSARETEEKKWRRDRRRERSRWEAKVSYIETNPNNHRGDERGRGWHQRCNLPTFLLPSFSNLPNSMSNCKKRQSQQYYIKHVKYILILDKQFNTNQDNSPVINPTLWSLSYSVHFVVMYASLSKPICCSLMFTKGKTQNNAAQPKIKKELWYV